MDAWTETARRATPDVQLPSELWIDQPDAEGALRSKVAAGSMTATEAAHLRSFLRDGYMVLDLEPDERALANIQSSVELLWQTGAHDLLAAGPYAGGRPVPLTELAEHIEPGPGVRLLDLHSHCPGALALYLDERVHRYCELILDARPIATQSLYFGHGSTQRLHRDPWYVNHEPRTNLLAAWFALEDIHADSGPLTYVRGSHRPPSTPLPTATSCSTTRRSPTKTARRHTPTC